MDLAKKAEDGELLQVVEREAPARRQANQPAGTKSRMVWYVDTDRVKIALVHEYRHPVGSIGGSGRPDPTRLDINGEILYC
jgi:hypothetical protein